MTTADAIEQIYTRIPAIDCQKKCHTSCGPIMMSEAEEQRIVQQVGHRTDFLKLTCPMLSMFGRCNVYEVRPAICRLYGVVKAMRCPHGCEPDRWLTDQEASEIIWELSRLQITQAKEE